MLLTVNIDFEGGERPPAGVPVRIEARDISLADAPAEVLGETRGEVAAGNGSRLAVFELELSRAALTSTVWAHVDSDRDGRVSRGDLITTESFPIPPDGSALTVRVRRV